MDSLESLVLEVSWEQPSFLLQEKDILARVALAQKELLELPSLAVTVAVLAQTGLACHPWCPCRP